MDFAAHALYGATFCSRSGIAGGSRGPRTSLMRDWTLWAAVGFGVLPDVISMGVPFLNWLMAGAGDNVGYFFRDFDGSGLIVYRYMHSLLIAGGCSALLFCFQRKLFVPSLAWIVHIITDALTHGLGKFKTTLFYPLTDWAIDGWPWWKSGWVTASYWLVLLITWLVLAAIRHNQTPAK